MYKKNILFAIIFLSGLFIGLYINISTVNTLNINIANENNIKEFEEQKIQKPLLTNKITKIKLSSSSLKEIEKEESKNDYLNLFKTYL
ncbi:hypothetical protein, partial [Arcobacter sp. F2176]|uniref:hypothetical protein n=1 Tax=Arcobacter sp. F2176 TaxID=2044511 RepID=UPI0010272080